MFAMKRAAMLVTDCKSLYDTITKERVLLSDRRLSLESAILRCELKHNFTTKWVKSEQQLADILTKTLSGARSKYARTVFETNL